MEVSKLKAIKHHASGNVHSGPGDAQMLQEKLISAFEASPQVLPSPDTTQREPQIGPPIERRRFSGGQVWFGRIGKSLVALAILVAVVWAPVSVMLQSSSVEAVVNATLIVLRAPIEGEVIAQNLPGPGDTVPAGGDLLRIENNRFDRTATEGLRQQITGLAADRPAILNKLISNRIEAAFLRKQLEAFRKARLAILDVDQQILDQQITAEEERQKLAADEAARARSLRKVGVISSAFAEKANSEKAIATSVLEEIKLRRERLTIERKALENWVFLGDGYNDRPQSAQLLDDVERRITELESELATNSLRRTYLQASLDRVQNQQTNLSQAKIIVPNDAKVWQVLVSPGEQVVRGQEMARLLSCKATVVTAAVDETTYNRLYSGMPTHFIPRGTSDSLRGTIVNLTGMADASSNYAIEPSALVKEPYRVTVSVPALASADECAIGRTGRVMFGDDGQQLSMSHFVNSFRHYFQ